MNSQTFKSMQTLARISLPYSDMCIQRTTHYVYTIKLQRWHNNGLDIYTAPRVQIDSITCKE